MLLPFERRKESFAKKLLKGLLGMALLFCVVLLLLASTSWADPGSSMESYPVNKLYPQH